jgi:chromosome segregation ATPase
MRNFRFGACCIFLLLTLDAQSLVDFARQEAERRRQLEQQGVHGKVIEGNGQRLEPDSGNLSTSTEPGVTHGTASGRQDTAKDQASLRRFQTALRKLDREIQRTDSRLASLQSRIRAEKWENVKTGRSAGRSRTKDSRSKSQAEMEKLQAKLKELRDERFEVIEAGKKMGFFPGELDGKGLMP